MKDYNHALADLLVQERLTAPVHVNKRWTWRQKCAHILDAMELHLQVAIECHPDLDRVNVANVVAFRDAITFARRLLGTNGLTYRDTLQRMENRIKAADEGDDIAFIAHLEVLLLRFRHPDG